NYYAEALVGLGRFEEAVFAAQQGLAQSIEDGSPENMGGAWRALGLVTARTGETITIKDRATGDSVEHDARTCFAKSEKIFAEAEIHGERARTLREWARYELKAGNQERAVQMWQEARGIYAKLGADKEVQRMENFPV
ncbi:MAG: hypothetical protein M3Y68_00950, partial [Chloroflexota bacterium]|nr:hypothetical protein [Chloroflexota bacterium]